jgi:hypothetical protein
MDQFELDDDDRSAVELAKGFARRLLREDRITPRQIRGLACALHALEQLPSSTPGASTEFGIEYRNGDTNFEEMRYVLFRIAEDTFEVSSGGSVYDKAIGSDSFSDPGLRIEFGGCKEGQIDAYTIEATLTEFLGLGGRIIVDDESTIDFDAPPS